MALSGTTSFTLNRNELILSALRLTTVYESGESVPDQEVGDASEALNMILKGLAVDGLHLWVIKEFTLALVASQTSYTIGPSGDYVGDRPLRVLDNCFIREGTSDTTLDLLSREEYFALGDKSTEGVPNSIYYDPQLTNGVLYVYVTPDTATAASHEIHVKYSKLLDDVDSALDDVEIPQEWFRTLRYMLAADLGVEYGLADTRPATLNMISGRAAKLRKDLVDWDVENVSTQFTPERRR